MPESYQSTVLVLGAGFTRAFVPDFPLLVDHYELKPLLDKYTPGGFPRANDILAIELASHDDGRVDIERLMTRLEILLPYDYEVEVGAEAELKLLLRDIKKEFMAKLERGKSAADRHDEDLAAIARVCIDNSVHCITFNYDVFDEQLWLIRGATTVPLADVPYWHPDGGYGFYCRPSRSCVGDTLQAMDRTSMSLLKLHGSMNWRRRRGASSATAVDALVHHEKWYPPSDYEAADFAASSEEIENHLSSEPFIVPPVLAKAGLSEEPVLRLIWHLAYKILAGADRVIFVGYSLPITDLAARSLFSEALRNLSSNKVTVVNLAEDGAAREVRISAYQSVLPRITDMQFDFRGALEWSRDFVNSAPSGQVPA